MRKRNRLWIALCSSSILVACAGGCGGGETTAVLSVEASGSSNHGYPISPDVVTTVDQSIVPVAVPVPPIATKPFPYEMYRYAAAGYGFWTVGDGVAPVTRLDLLPTGYTASARDGAVELLHFFAISDVHITDKESPANAFNNGYKGGLSDAFAPTMML